MGHLKTEKVEHSFHHKITLWNIVKSSWDKSTPIHAVMKAESQLFTQIAKLISFVCIKHVSILTIGLKVLDGEMIHHVHPPHWPALCCQTERGWFSSGLQALVRPVPVSQCLVRQ